ncbi:hypothetical protein ACFQHO_52315 [Actinomadura yumaensis]|uniref:hypothetical protein n=1 Tax=Actinomadura yumaensis TaxID=111807 RepID=UPI00360FA423
MNGDASVRTALRRRLQTMLARLDDHPGGAPDGPSGEPSAEPSGMGAERIGTATVDELLAFIDHDLGRNRR